MTQRISITSSIGRSWQNVAESAALSRRAGSCSESRLFKIENGVLTNCSEEGPLVYVVLGHQVVQYVGQTRQPLSVRIGNHLRNPAKAQNWSHVAAITLDYDTSAARVDEIERRARDMLRPRMGSSWPRKPS